MALERITGERREPEAEEKSGDGEARGVSADRRGHDDETENRSDRGEQCDYWVSTPLGTDFLADYNIYLVLHVVLPWVGEDSHER